MCFPCLACLGAVVNKITHNYSLIRDVFKRYQSKFIFQIIMCIIYFNFEELHDKFNGLCLLMLCVNYDSFLFL